MDHTLFDQRHYPVLPVRAGYGEWAQTYDGVVQDEMDLRLWRASRASTGQPARPCSISPAAPGGSVPGFAYRASQGSTAWISPPRC